MSEEFKARFWARVNKTDGCWLWTGTISHNGYPQFWYQHKTFSGHRTAWELVTGQNPRGFEVRHSCGQPLCCNPAHLYLDRPNAHGWRGGRTVGTNGYVLVRVGRGHHLANRHGYAYEHRVVAERTLGRQLLRTEEVHHLNHVKTDNRPKNLLVTTPFEHRAFHHRKKNGRMLPNESNDLILCACGCGGTLRRYDEAGRPRTYIYAHNLRLRSRKRKAPE